MDYIRGISREQILLFPEIIDDYIAEDNPVRFLDVFVATLDLVELDFKQSCLNHTGRPPYNPSDLLKLYLYGYLNRVRSSRRLESECRRNVELMWLMRKLKPDFKTIADFRRDNLKALKGVCRKFTLLCKQLNLFDGELISIDGSKFEAVNSTQRNYTKKKLEKLIREIEERIGEYFQLLDREDEKESDVEGFNAEELKEKIATLSQRKVDYEELLDCLEDNADQQSDRDKQVSLTDSDSRLMRDGHGGKDICYNVQIAVDEKHRLIVADDVTNEGSDRKQLSKMAKQAKEVLEVDELDALADAGYHNSEEIKACVDADITPYVPRPRQSPNNKKGLFTKSDFIYDSELDTYTCPAGKQLTKRFSYKRSGRLYHAYETPACSSCILRSKCIDRKRGGRRISRWEYEHLLEEMQHRLEERPEMIDTRRCMVEHPFGTLKRWMGHHYFLMRGLEKVKVELSLSVMAYNMKRVLNIIGVENLIEAMQAVLQIPKTVEQYVWRSLIFVHFVIMFWVTASADKLTINLFKHPIRIVE